MTTNEKTILLSDDRYLAIGLNSLLNNRAHFTHSDIKNGMILIINDRDEFYNNVIIDNRSYNHRSMINAFANHLMHSKKASVMYLVNKRGKTTPEMKKLEVSLFNSRNGILLYKHSFPDQNEDLPEKLTRKESSIVFYFINGFDSHSIARFYGVSVKTIHSHKYNALAKLGFEKISDLVIFINEVSNCKVGRDILKRNLLMFPTY